MKLSLRPVTPVSSRGEVFFDRKKRRRGQQSGGEFQVARVPKFPPPSAEHRRFVELRERLGLDEHTAASALGVKLEQLRAMERGELQPVAAEVWALVEQALLDAADKVARGPAPEW